MHSMHCIGSYVATFQCQNDIAKMDKNTENKHASISMEHLQ